MFKNTKKIKNYADGEIRQTVDGYYIFVTKDSHAGPYVSVSALMGAVPETAKSKVMKKSAKKAVK